MDHATRFSIIAAIDADARAAVTMGIDEELHSTPRWRRCASDFSSKGILKIRSAALAALALAAVLGARAPRGVAGAARGRNCRNAKDQAPRAAKHALDSFQCNLHVSDGSLRDAGQLVNLQVLTLVQDHPADNRWRHERHARRNSNCLWTWQADNRWRR